MVSTPKRFTDNSPISPGPPIIDKKCSARKSLHLFTEALDVKNKTTVRRVGDAKSKLKAISSVSMVWSSIQKRKGYTKINAQVQRSIYSLILQHPQVVQYPISNDCLKVSIGGHSEPQFVPKILLQVSLQELHNSMASPPEEGGLREARYAYNNIINSDSTQRSIIPPQLNIP